MSVPTNLLSANTSSIETDTSGWVGGANTTKSMSSRFYQGAASLGLTATAAGFVAATTATRVAVVAGTTYQAYAFFANLVAASGRVATVRIEWFDVATGGTALSSSTSAGSTLANATSWNTPPPGIIAVAPAGATYASIVVMVTGMTAGATVAVDLITFGTPYTVTGNILPYASMSVEQDVGAWTGWTNCTVGRSTTDSREGWYSLQLTAVAAGTVASRLSTTVPVTPGTEYLSQVMVKSTTGAPVRLDIQWCDAASTLLGTASETRTVPSDGTWTALQVVSVAPPTAAGARIIIGPTASAAGDAWLCDLMTLLPTSARAVAGNLLPYTVADMEPNLSGWTVTGGVASQSTTTVVSGVYSMKVVASGGDLTLTTVSPVTGVTLGVGYQFGLPVYQTATAYKHTDLVEWLDANGVVLRSRWQSWQGMTGEWRVGYMGDIAPAGAVAVRLGTTFEALPAGATIYFDRATFIVGGLVASAEPAGGGGAAITVRGLTTGGPTWTWSLLRYVGGETPQPVRGWTGDLTNVSITGDLAVITDYEAPLGVPVQWRVVLDGGSQGRFYYTTDSVTLDAETLDVWIKDPGLPARSVHATVQTLPEWQRAARQGVNQVRGRSRPIVISDVRLSRTGTVGLVTQSDDERDALWWVLDSGNTLLLQWPPGFGERDVYVSVGDVAESRLTDLAEHTDRTWTLPLTEVDRPLGGMVGSPDRTWQDVADAGSTWADALADATTWLDVYTGVSG